MRNWFSSKFADGTDAAVAEVIDVVHLPDVFAKLQQISNDGIEVCRLEDPLLERRGQVQLDVELQPADLRKVVLARVEEHAFEQRCCRLQRRRITGAQLSIDFDQRFLCRLDGVLAERQTENDADVVALRERRPEARELRHR